MRILFLLSIVSSSFVIANSPFIMIRPQGAHTERELAGWLHHTHLNDAESNYGTVSLMPIYSKSFHSQQLAKCLFGNDLLGCDCRAIKISGSGVAGRDATKEWLADYFGLPRDYQSTISFAPRIENIIVDFNSYFGLDELYKGLFIKIHAPIVYTKWNLHFTEDIHDKGSANHHPGYFNGCITLGTGNTTQVQAMNPKINVTTYSNAYGIPRSSLLNSFSAYAYKQKTPALGSTNCQLPKQTATVASGATTIDTTLVNVTTPAITFNPLRNAQFACPGCDDLSKFGIADVNITFGWNALLNHHSHVGLGIQLTLPTGNRPQGKTVFEPIIGNGKHVAFGGLFTARTTMWETEDEKQKLFLSVDCNITHLFGAKQQRTFDLINKPNSRYMLAQKMKSPATQLTGGTTAGASPTTTKVPSAQFAHEFTPVANLTTFNTRVSIGVQTDTVFMMSYQHGDFVWDIGYNLWTRSCEKIKLQCNKNNTLADGKTWALKGDAQVYGYAGTTAPSNTTLDPLIVSLSGTQSAATIHAGANGYTSIDTTVGTPRPTTNPGVNFPLYAVNATTPAQVINDNPNIGGVNIINPLTGGNFMAQQVQTSVDPVFLSVSDIDVDGARTKGLSHTVFTNIIYTWVGRKEHCDPYIGGGIEGEFHAKNNRSKNKSCNISSCNSSARSSSSSSCKNACSSCNYCGVSQWSVWIKGGVSFN